VARVVITEFCDPDAVELLTAVHDVTYDRKLADRPGVLLTLVADADALVVRNRTRVDADLLAAAPICEIGRLGVGLDNIDVAVCESGGVAVRTAAGADAVAVAEHVIGALLSLARPALRATGRILGGEWPRTDLVGIELAGRHLGLVGLGATAREVAARGLGLGMEVVAFDPFVTEAPAGITLADLEDVFRVGESISVHVPLTPETTGLVDATRPGLLPAGALLVDTSRGGVVDHRAVVEAPHAGHLGGAALDVFAKEPPVMCRCTRACRT